MNMKGGNDDSKGNDNDNDDGIDEHDLPYIREFCQLVDEYERGTSGDWRWHWFGQKNKHLVMKKC